MNNSNSQGTRDLTPRAIAYHLCGSAAAFRIEQDRLAPAVHPATLPEIAPTSRHARKTYQKDLFSRHVVNAGRQDATSKCRLSV
jgi:hypothetical protein